MAQLVRVAIQHLRHKPSKIKALQAIKKQYLRQNRRNHQYFDGVSLWKRPCVISECANNTLVLTRIKKVVFEMHKGVSKRVSSD